MTAAVLRMPTRTAAEPDLPPCRRSWGDDCGPADRPGAHTCWTYGGWPHVCRCLRCDRGPAGGAR